MSRKVWRACDEKTGVREMEMILLTFQKVLGNLITWRILKQGSA